MRRSIQSLEDPGRKNSKGWNCCFGPRRRVGLTLIEVIVIVAVLLLLAAAFIVPMIGRPLPRARLTNVLNNGKQIYTFLRCSEQGDALGIGYPEGQVKWPSSTTDSGQRVWKDSSEFMNDLITNGGLDVFHGFFTAPGGGVRAASNEVAFLDGTLHNIWCITLDVTTNTPAKCPVLFTQNFKFRSAGSDATLDQMTGLEKRARPYGARIGAVVVMRDGSGLCLEPSRATPTNFNLTGATNRFLWPLAGGQDLGRPK